jgi:hypothetical protein
MTAYYSATIETPPLLFFFFKELVDTFVPDVFQVLNHAQVIFGAVAFIESFEPAAGEVLAFIAEPHKPIPDQVAMLFHKNTALATWQATGAVSPLEPFLVDVVF